MGKDAIARPVEVTAAASALLELLQLAEKVCSGNEFLDQMRNQVKLASAGGEQVVVGIEIRRALD